MKKIFIFSLMFVLVLQTTLWAELPFEKLANFDRHQLFKTEPVATSFNKSRVTIEFETTHPSLAASVSYGIEVSDGETINEMLRSTRSERLKNNEMTTKHKVVIDLSYFEKIQYGKNLIDDHGGVIPFRVQDYDSKAGFMQYYKGKFAYRRVGKVKKGRYYLVPAILEGPFVDCVTDNSAVISWKTDRKSNGYLILKEKYGRHKRKFYGRNSRKYNEIKIKNLKSDTIYSYTVYPGRGGFKSFTYSFKTSPGPGSRKPFSFVFMSDGRNGTGSGIQNFNGVNVEILNKLLDRADVEKVALMIFGGDLVNGYSSSVFHMKTQFRTWKKAIERLAARIPVYEAVGNHEVCGDYYKLPDELIKGKKFLAFKDKPASSGNNVEAIFSKEFVNPRGSVYGFGSPKPEIRGDLKNRDISRGPDYGETVYSFNRDNIHFIVLNTNYWTTAVKGSRWGTRHFADKEGNFEALEMMGGNREGYIMKNQRAWLNRDLKRAQEDKNIDWIFVVFHEPMFPNGGHLIDAMFWGENGHGERGGINIKRALGDVTKVRDELIKTFMKYPKTLVILTGDEHNYSRTLVDKDINKEYNGNFWQIISGGAGAPYYLQDKSVKWLKNVKAFSPLPHLCLFKVFGKKVFLKVISYSGKILDEVEITKIK